jgi:TDG/mug DNA glycosylase family protein
VDVYMAGDPADQLISRRRADDPRCACPLSVVFWHQRSVVAAVGRHFGRPGNRFWPALHQVDLRPASSPGGAGLLLQHGLGITNLRNAPPREPTS